MPRRTEQELIAVREEQNRKSRLRLARAKNPKVEMVEATIADLCVLAREPELAPNSPGEVTNVVGALQDMLARLVSEATK